MWGQPTCVRLFSALAGSYCPANRGNLAEPREIPAFMLIRTRRPVAPGDQEAPLTEQGPGQGWPGQAAGQGRAKPPPPDATAQYARPQPSPPPGQAPPPQAPPPQAPPPQAPPPQAPPAEVRTATQGFINSLFDFSFSSFVTPK